MRGLVGQHRLAADVADRVDVPHVGPHLQVGLDEAAVGDVHARLVGADHVAVGLAADRHEDPVELLGVVAELDRQALLVRLHRLDAGLEVDRLVTALDALLEHADQVLVDARDDWSSSSTTVTLEPSAS